MRPLITTAQIDTELRRLLNVCTACQIAVAWASAGSKAFSILVRNRHKIRRMIVGTHFCQTDPSFIAKFLSQPDVVRFLLNPDGVFHPKIYLFERSDEAWECIVGSPNFTHGGLTQNDEVALLVTHDDKGAVETLAAIQSTIDGYWERSKNLSSEELERYAATYKRNRPALRQLRGEFGPPDKPNDDGGRSVSATKLLQTSWSEFCAAIRQESRRPPYNHTMQSRLRMLGEIRQLFRNRTHLRDMQLDERKRVAGLVGAVGDGENQVDYCWFGGMRGAGKFWTAIKEHADELSLALDAIPDQGSVSRQDYLKYVEQFKRAFPGGRHGIATATRLLAMKRPDWFLCLDAANGKGLCKQFEIPLAVDYEQYWDSIIARIIDPQTIWWNASEPQAGMERDVWRARTAFLDAIYYDEM